MPSPTHRTYLLIALGVLVLSAATIFTGTRLHEPSTGPAEPKERDDGSLVIDPPPLTLDEVAAADPEAPFRSVIELWYWGQWGSAANAVRMYDPRVIEAVGEETMLGTYANLRGYLALSIPRVVEDVEEADGSRTLTVEAQLRDTPPDPYTFTLMRRDGRWLITHDTLLENGIILYINAQGIPLEEGQEALQELEGAVP